MSTEIDFPIPLRASVINELKQGVFELDCLSMTLKSKSDEALIFQGPGYVKQVPGKGFIFKIYAALSEDSPRFLHPFRTIKAGQFIPANAYYSLTARDTSGCIWTCDTAIPSPDYFFEDAQYTVVQGKLGKITAIGSDSVFKRPVIIMRFRGAHNLSLNASTTVTETTEDTLVRKSGSLNRAKVCSCGYQFEILKEADCLEVKIFSEREAFPKYFEQRVCEALEFVLAKPMRAFTLEKHDESSRHCEIREYSPRELNSSLNQPLLPHLADPDSFWTLFDRYLAYTVAYQESEVHPISRIVNFTILASTGSIYTQALVIGVAVEDLLTVGFAEIGNPSNELINHVKKAQELMQLAAGLNDTFKKRVTGALGSLLKSRPKDKLLVLVTEGRITQEQCEAWEKLRNATAHAEYERLGSLQDVSLLSNKVLVLFYHLVFSLISYYGNYTDYGTLDWPTQTYTQYPAT